MRWIIIYKTNNKRLAKYLYSLGFNRESKYINDREYWIFKESSNLNESLDFYFYMRKQNRE